MQASEDARLSLSRIVGCHDDELAFFQSTAGAISQMAFAIDLKPGDEILMWDQEYSSNLYPWREAARKRGAKLILAPSGPGLETPVQSLLERITEKTKVIAISWVQFQTGAITDLAPLAEFARERGIWTVIDIIQGLGLLPFNFHELGFDAVCGGSHKWLASPVGVGYLALKRERTAQIEPLLIGSGTYGTCDDPASLVCEAKIDARKFEAGSKQVLEIVALGASSRLIEQTGVPVIARAIEENSLRLSQILKDAGYKLHSPHGSQQRGSIVNFSGTDQTKFSSALEIAARLKEHHISFALRGPGVRLSPHAFNTAKDLERVKLAIC
jgi:selenocysteine lyase/cysteine desulfurase